MGRAHLVAQGDGKFQELGGGDFRSSSNSWCTGSCASDATVRSVEARIANLTGFPVANMEYLQILSGPSLARLCTD